MPDDGDGSVLAVEPEADGVTERKAFASGPVHDLRGGLPRAPIAQIALGHGDFGFLRQTRQQGFERDDVRPDLRKTARRHEIRAGRNRAFELGLKMLFITVPAECDAHCGSSSRTTH